MHVKCWYWQPEGYVLCDTVSAQGHRMLPRIYMRQSQVIDNQICATACGCMPCSRLLQVTATGFEVESGCRSRREGNLIF
jgi:hypothetical protein